MPTFKECVGDPRKPCQVPNGGDAGYGCAWGPRGDGTNPAIMSFRYTACSGIITFTPPQGEEAARFTLSHVPPGGLAPRALALHAQFLVDHAIPHGSFVRLVGACASGRGDNGSASGSPCQEVLRAAGFPEVPNYTGRAGTACDVGVSSKGIFIHTRYPKGHALEFVSFTDGGVGGDVDAPGPTAPQWFKELPKRR